MKNLLKRHKAKRQQKFINKLEAQKFPLTKRQFIKLCKMDLPEGSVIHELMFEWAKKSMERQDRENKRVAHFIGLISDKLRQQIKWEEAEEKNKEALAEQTTVFQTNLQSEKKKKKPAVLRLSSILAVCAAAVCLAIILPLTLANNGYIDDKGYINDDKRYIEEGSGEDLIRNYIATNARMLAADGGFDGLYAKISDEKLLIFKNIYHVVDTCIEVYNDETEELLSYAFHSLLADASAGENFVVFAIDYRIRFVEQYKFRNHSFYEDLKNNINVGATNVKFEIQTGLSGEIWAYVSFKFENYDYFLRVNPIGTGSEAVTELNLINLILLMQNLIPH